MKALKWSVCALLCAFLLMSFTDAIGKRGETTKTFDVAKGGNLVVDIENVGADIQVKVWSKSEVSVRAEGISEDDSEWLEIEKEGNTVNVFFDADNGWGRHRSVRFYISVPSEFNLDLGTSGGDVEVVGAIKGTVVAATAGGDIEIDDVDGGVELRTAGGDIAAGNVIGDAKLQTAGGDIEVGKVSGKLVAQTAGGDIEASEVEKDLQAETAGGDITCANVGGDALAKTSGGDVELGVVKGEVSARTAGGDIGVRGGTGAAVAKTAGGDIELAGIKGYVDVATAGGDIIVELDPTNESASDLETKGGDITLYLPAKAKATVEALIRLRDRRGDYEEYDIRSDFEAESHDRDQREIRARYVINGGGKVIKIETTNGNIDVRKK